MGWKYQWVDRPHIRQVPESVCKSGGMEEAGWSLQGRTDGLQDSRAVEKGKKIAVRFDEHESFSLDLSTRRIMSPRFQAAEFHQ